MTSQYAKLGIHRLQQQSQPQDSPEKLKSSSSFSEKLENSAAAALALAKKRLATVSGFTVQGKLKLPSSGWAKPSIAAASAAASSPSPSFSRPLTLPSLHTLKESPTSSTFFPAPSTTAIPSNSSSGSNILVTSDQLAYMLDSPSTKLLLIDLRSFNSYSQGHVIGSISAFVSFTLLKRKNLAIIQVADLLQREQDREKLRNWKSCHRVILIDEGLASGPSLPALSFISKFNADMKECGGGGGVLLSWLNCSVADFEKKYRRFVKPVDPPDSSSPANMNCNPATNTSSPNSSPFASDAQTFNITVAAPLSPRQASTSSTRSNSLMMNRMSLSLAPLPAIACPTPMIEASPFFGQLMTSIRPDTTLRESQEQKVEIAVKLPVNLTNMDRMLPSWLAKACRDPSHIRRVYNRLKEEEETRIRKMLVFHARNSSIYEPATKARLGAESLTKRKFTVQAALRNPSKNRYNNIWPYDWNRVRLAVKDHPMTSTTASSSFEDNDYINASWVDENRYICSQAPTHSTIKDFINMLWTSEVLLIVALAKEGELGWSQCERYWPNPSSTGWERLGGSVERGGGGGGEEEEDSYEAMFLSEEHEGSFLTIRKFQLRQNSLAPRQIIQIQYHGWPDHGVPDDATTFLRVIKELDKYRSSISSPILVHCSAGCGRSGTFCAVDILIRKNKQSISTTAAAQVDDDVWKTDLMYLIVKNLREERMEMVQTLRQLVFAYEAYIHWWWWHMSLNLLNV